ncbi:hypothetical protein [Streptomyces malaysiensis]|uniref:Uncharacterized protein n=1 Tax=Streptomyces malaysiensis subsp. samsunensis TaxID=459658 RepID=A0A9X2RVC5_STRMQ|nr:hypothetical protein [Streptomyces samsunensis]MCQ8832137.1 hypothetical protein [Streptomyces samsunensis]
MFDATIALLNDHARIALCGLIDGCNLPHRPPGPSNFGMLLTKRVTTQGFIVLDHMSRAREAEEHLASLIRDKEIDPCRPLSQASSTSRGRSCKPSRTVDTPANWSST